MRPIPMPTSVERETRVTIDGTTVFVGFTDPADRWNGWLAEVGFTRTEAERVAEWANAGAVDHPEDSDSFEWDGDVLVHHRNAYADAEPERAEPDADGRYTIGACDWTWTEADDG